MDDDTIFASATAAGRAPVGILRISGPRAGEAAVRLSGGPPPEPRRAALRRLRDPCSGEVIDQALLLWFPGPRSETGEDLLEVQHHGGHAVLAALIGAISDMTGFRPAGPGEFTRRAFLNSKLDLTAAEGLADLIDATSRAQARQALRQLDGELGRLYAGWRERLLQALSLLEAEIDFAPDEEVPDSMLARIRPSMEQLGAEVAAHLADGGRGERLRTGVTVAVIGPPNVGKSTLVNLLARRDVAIVTPIPGTTRDVIEVQLDLDGVPVTLLDTAGLRETDDPIEQEGIARARSRAEQADLRLYVVEAGAAAEDVPELDDRTIVLRNKADLAPDTAGLAISCRNGMGVPAMLGILQDRARRLVDTGEAPLLTRARHREALSVAQSSLERFMTASADERDLALLAEELRLAARAVGRITGTVGVEDVLDRIFSTFCIGK
ncbi:MAG: tRNA uridine-5-carboxymethylaminomethyl(34) synthesis GTPase MnmE [Geminicoccaceae bacterium]